MNKLILDSYSDFLIFNQGQAAATIFSEATDGLISHDKFTRFLNSGDFGAKELWKFSRPMLKGIQQGVLAIDDFICEKPYSKISDINCYHYSHMKGRCLKGVEIISALFAGEDINVPVDYKIISKPTEFCDIETKRLKRKSLVSKNVLARELIQSSLDKELNISYITADSWFCCGDTLEFIEAKAQKYIFAIKSNRKVYLTEYEREINYGYKLSEVELKDDVPTPFFINNVNHMVYIMKKTFTNGDGTTGVLFLVTNDGELSGDDLYLIYHKRWGIEVFHKSIKNNTSLSKSPASKQRGQKNHIFCSLYAYLKLERIKIKEKKNHFSLKRDIQIFMLKSCRAKYKKKFSMAA